ncbi:hypothetical protein MANES_S023652v8 [Manihot esculenta]|uniref:Uncharacterized protein n=1 Tax=Manihot esculenta TaxID=3983 RepID=A0ACB7FVF9_MANES|nr:hypothetical protein MANES_S023652v8 [Manihot esculenta]
MLKLSGWFRLTWGRDVRPRPCPRVFQPPIAVAIAAEDSAFGPAACALHTREANVRPRAPATGRRGWRRRLRDTQADVPSAGWLRAQLAFKNSMVRGILQFTPSIAFCCVLHRCESRDIRCRESFWFSKEDGASRTGAPLFVSCSLALLARGWLLRPRRARGARAGLRTGMPPRPWRRRGPKPPAAPDVCEHVRGSCCRAGFDNDPSAGSPTETLLRLLLPLNDKVQWTSRDVAGGEPPTSPRSEHFTGPFNR